MPASDKLARGAAVLMALSASWNVLASLRWITYFGWLMVGLAWIVPLLLACAELALAVVVLATGHRKALVAGPLVGLFVCLCNVNLWAMPVELMALALGVGGSMVQLRSASA
ncbi:MAG: hypothetical protein KTR31_26685 [Myxococcales bacterium]|nr:hypothetical protein [Myxococcales bacterium]